MKRALFTLMLAAVVLSVASPAHAGLFRRFSDYMYVSDQEETVFDEIVWFWTPDTIYGAAHFNSQFGIKYSPQFHGPIFCSAGDAYHGAGYYPWFAYPPQFNFPEIDFPEMLEGLRTAANVQGTFFHNPDSALQFRCTTDEDGWVWWAWDADQPWDSSDVSDQGEVEFGEHVLFFEGPLQVFGESIEGNTTIGTAGDIRIMDNLLLHPYTTENLPDNIDSYVPHNLGLASEGHIWIANTEPNGRGNGLYADGNNHDSAHVVIMAALLALDESFILEDQNDVWDDYIWCDPEGEHPGESDERGTIFLYGSLAQKRRNYVHRSNCSGTGYAKQYRYDERFQTDWPPEFPEIDWVEGGNVLEDEILVNNTITINGDNEELKIFGSLFLGPGAHVVIEDGAADIPMTFYGADLHVEATSDDPAVIEITSHDNDPVQPWECIWADSGYGFTADTLWEYLHVIGDEVRLPLANRVTGLEVDANELILESYHSWQGADNPIDIDHARLHADQIHMSETNQGRSERFRRLSYSEVTGRIHSRFNHIYNCTFVFDANEQFQNMVTNEVVEMLNACFWGESTLIGSVGPLTIDYSSYFNLEDEPFVGMINEGVHMLADTDPRFVNHAGGNYHLREDSPLIDAGSPWLPNDPDGTLSDIGAYYFDQLAAPELGDAFDQLPASFGIESVFPNPFNPTTEVRLALPEPGEVCIELVDVLGRRVAVLYEGAFPAGRYSFTVDGSRLASGVYFVRATAGSKNAVRKLTLLK